MIVILVEFDLIFVGIGSTQANSNVLTHFGFCPGVDQDGELSLHALETS